jgi:hypothetical protein
MDSESDDDERQMNSAKEDMKNARIHTSDFSKGMETKAVRYATEAMGRGKMDKDCASYIKQKVDTDAEFNDGSIGAWQVIVGKSFAASLTYNTNFMMFFDLIKQRRTILIFKTQ